MERLEPNPFGRSRPEKPEKVLREEMRERQKEIDRRAQELDLRLREVMAVRDEIENRAWLDRDHMSREQWRAIEQRHWECRSQIGELTEAREDTREQEAELDALAADVRQARRAEAKERDRERWKEACQTLEDRLVQREEREEARRAIDPSGPFSLGRGGELSDEAQRAFFRKGREDDRER